MTEQLAEYEVTMKLLVRSSLDKERLRQLLVVPSGWTPKAA